MESEMAAILKTILVLFIIAVAGLGVSSLFSLNNKPRYRGRRKSDPKW